MAYTRDVINASTQDRFLLTYLQAECYWAANRELDHLLLKLTRTGAVCYQPVGSYGQNLMWSILWWSCSAETIDQLGYLTGKLPLNMASTWVHTCVPWLAWLIFLIHTEFHLESVKLLGLLSLMKSQALVLHIVYMITVGFSTGLWLWQDFIWQNK